jgi:hypothetical protein
MAKAGRDHVIGIPVSSRAFGIEEPEFPCGGAAYHGDAKYSTTNTRGSGRSGRAGDKFAKGIKEHGESLSNPPEIYILTCSSIIASVTNQKLNMCSLMILQ